MLMPRAKDAMDGPGLEENLALIQTIFGENSRAISTLTQLLQTPYWAYFQQRPLRRPFLGSIRSGTLCVAIPLSKNSARTPVDEVNGPIAKQLHRVCHGALPWFISLSLDAERNDRAVRLRIAVLGASAKIVISSMSLADLASLASSVAVVVSLLFLGLQIRQSNRNQRSLMQQGRSARNVELLSRLSDPRVSDVISRAGNGETLTDQDCFVLYSYMTSVFWSYEEDFFQFHLGMLDPKSWASDGTVLRRLLGNPAYRAVWRFARGGIGDEYRSFLDGLAAESRHNRPAQFAQHAPAIHRGRERSAPEVTRC